jgi:hypothetical protein
MHWNFKFRYLVVLIFIGLLFSASVKIMKRDIDWPTALEENEFSVIIFPLAGARLEANDDAVTRDVGRSSLVVRQKSGRNVKQNSGRGNVFFHHPQRRCPDFREAEAQGQTGLLQG